ncbi:CGNR zinc finger domain-containing protein [Kineosporia sp. NBRC 101731]|uniref:CGNR zinc finger domain-containing protein n=1 Tax=Kineosporia sp. NBRC 101731 TaxID=3032199 RepID=UPI0024A40E91|nr:CGNR zinc finger domain-containing protein [Kineosporia sp. NBRC 101731]GLY29697.1 hypothetical protein Kisp02_30620 [Kineosporia sp. NBRC 101731]
MFVYVSNRLSLDLLGTLKWRSDVPEEHLLTAHDVATWSQGSSLGVPVATDEAGLARVRDVREMLYRAITAAQNGQELIEVEVAQLNEIARGPAPELHLDQDGRVSRSADIDALLTAVVRDGLELLAGPQAPQIRNCANDRCTRLYVDTSRAGNRRWCGMAECGNAAKVAAFRARQRS